MQFGNQDTEQKHDISNIKKIAEDRYVVRHFRTGKYADGTEFEDPTTSRIQIYDKTAFENLSSLGQKRQADGSMKQTPSQFQEAGLNVHVLHDPTAAEVKTKTAAEVIAAIEAAGSAAEVDALIVDEVRKGVLSAADKKKKSFS